MEREGFTSSTSTTVIVEALEERTESALKQDKPEKHYKELVIKFVGSPGKGTEPALKQDGSPNVGAGKLLELHEKHFQSSGKGTEPALKQDGSLDEAGKLHKELYEKKFVHSGKGTEPALNQDGSLDEAEILYKESYEKKFVHPGKGTEPALKQDGSPNEAGNLLKELAEKHFRSSGNRTEQAPKQDGSLDEAGKLYKELNEKKFVRPGKGTEQVELPRNKKSEATNTNETNERTVNIYLSVVYNCNCDNRAQGTGCNVEPNMVDAKDSQFVGTFNCGNVSTSQINFNISHLSFVCLVFLFFLIHVLGVALLRYV